MYRLNPGRWGGLLTLLLLVSGMQTAQAQLFSVSVMGVDGLMETVKYGLKMSGKEDMAGQIDGLLEAFLQNQGFKGLNTKKAMGAYLNKFPSNPTQPSFVVYVPITNEKEFVDFLGRLNVSPSKEENGMRNIQLPTGQTVYLKIKENYAYISMDEGELKNPADPAKLADRLPANALLHVNVGFDEIPKELKEHFLAEVDKHIKSERTKKEGEDDTQYQLRMMGMMMPRQAIEHLVMDSQSLKATVMLDQKQHVFSFDTVLTPKPGSRLHQEMKVLSESKSQFSSLLESAPVSLVYHGAMSDSVRKDFDTLLDTIVKKAIADEKSIMKKALAEKIYQVMEPTLKAKTYELALSMRNTGEGPLTGLGALRVKDGKKIEELVKGLLVELKDKEKQAFQIDSDKAGDVNIHVINVPPEDKGTKEFVDMFGAAKVAVAFHNDAVVVGVGKHSVEEVKRVVLSLGQTGGKNPPPVQLLVHVKPFARFVKEAPVRRAFETVFTSPESDAVKISLTGGDQLHWRFQMSTQFLKLIEAAEKAKGE